MSHRKLKLNEASAPSEPRRNLRADFTAYTIGHAATAKRRANNKQQIKTFFKEPFPMKSLKFLRTAPGAVLAVAIIATTGVSAYTLNNWFNGAATVKEDNTILSVDLSQCKGSLPPGIEPNSDRSNVEFKILGSPYIAAEQLQQQLLAECEYNAVVDFYKNSANAESYNLYPSMIKAIGDKTIILDYFWGGKMNNKAFTLNAELTVYNQGKQNSLQDLKVGDTVVFAVNLHAHIQEDIDPLADVDEVKSIFKTQYDTKTSPGATKRAFYEESNIMPLNMYEQLY